MKADLLVETLKKELKKRSITYALLGQKVGLSEAAIKRAFAARNFSLRRLEQFCESIGLDLSELVVSAGKSSVEPNYLNPFQESKLAEDPELLLAFYLILLQQPMTEFKRQLKVDKIGIFKIARQLEKLGLIDLLPQDRFKPKVRKSIRWNPTGPLVKKYAISIQEEFFQSSFMAENEFQDFLTGALTSSSFKIIKRKQKELFQLFDELSEMDSKIKDEKTEGFWYYAGIRPWAPLNVVKRKL